MEYQQDLEMDVASGRFEVPIHHTMLHRNALKTLLASLVMGSCSNAFAQGPTITLTPSDYNGYNISCFGMKNGTIDATVTGGTAPYTFLWTNGATTEDLTDLPSGYYKLTVMDADSLVGSADITLVEPTELKVEVEPFIYPNKYNVSCYDCYNGSIEVSVFHGVTPYSYNWGGGITQEDRSGLGAGQYRVVVTDANGCYVKSDNMKLQQPERTDWTMEGNEGTDASVNFFGTTDEQDVVFKSNSQEVLRLKSNGDIGLLDNAAIGKGFLYLDGDGILRGGPYPYLDPLPVGLCRQLESYPVWETRGNLFEDLCEGVTPLLGTRSAHPLRVITNNVERMVVMTDGRIGMGTVPPGNAGSYRLYVEGGIATRDVLVKLGNWPDYVFQEGYHLLSLGELKNYLRTNKHLPGIPSAAEVDAKGGVEVGDLQKRMLETIEQQALYILQLEERVKAMEQRLNALETSK